MNLVAAAHNAYKNTYANYLRSLFDILESELEIRIELNSKQIYNLISSPPNLSMGHMAFPCFQLSRVLKMAPPQISEKLEALCKKQSPDLISRCRSVGPYLNIYFDLRELIPHLFKNIKSQEFFSPKVFESTPKTMVEYSQPNTHKQLHVGHMRNLCLGDALVRIFQYTGIETLKTTYPGDMGTHVAKCLWFLKNHYQGDMPTENKGAWLGDLYSQAETKWQEDAANGLEEANKTEGAKILKQIENESGEFYELWKETREWSFDQMKSIYQWAHVDFDHWYTESEVDEASLGLVDEYFKKGLFVLDQGAIGIDLSQYKLGFCLLKKSNGNGLYATKDLELAKRKFDDFGIEHSIYVVDKRQSLHFQQVFKTLELMGYEQAKNCFHLAYDYVELPSGAMSSRKGNIIPLQDLIDQMQNKIQEDFLSKHDDWSEEDKKYTAHIIAEGAIKYGMNRIDNNKKIVFKMDEWLKLDGDSGPYIQYVYARINSMIQKLSPEFENINSNYQLLRDQTEETLIIKLISFNDEIETAASQYRPSAICAYLYELAKSYNSFYAKCSINKADSPELGKARLELSEATASVIKQGLALLGITAPEKM